jgi:hypothetical protein
MHVKSNIVSSCPRRELSRPNISTINPALKYIQNELAQTLDTIQAMLSLVCLTFKLTLLISPNRYPQLLKIQHVSIYIYIYTCIMFSAMHPVNILLLISHLPFLEINGCLSISVIFSHGSLMHLIIHLSCHNAVSANWHYQTLPV